MLDVGRDHGRGLADIGCLSASSLGSEDHIPVEGVRVSGGTAGVAGIGPQRCGVVHHLGGQRQILEAGAELVESGDAEFPAGPQQLPPDLVIGDLGNGELVTGALVMPSPLISLPCEPVGHRVAQHPQWAAVQYEQHRGNWLEGTALGAARLREGLHEKIEGFLLLALVTYVFDGFESS